MANLQEFQTRLKKLNNRQGLYAIAFKIVKQTQHIALSLQKQQLSEGQDNTGKIIGTYSRATELEALFGDNKPRTAKVEGQPYNFEWSGEFFDNMYLLFGDDEVSFWSKGEAVPDLVEKYDNLLGLDDDNLPNYIRNSILPLLQMEARKVLQLG